VYREVRKISSIHCPDATLQRMLHLPSVPTADSIAIELDRKRMDLLGPVAAFKGAIGDLPGLDLIEKREAFAFFRVLVNIVSAS
jgi:hypothetical protein